MSWWQLHWSRREMVAARARLVNVAPVGNGQILKVEPTGLAEGPKSPEALGLSNLL